MMKASYFKTNWRSVSVVVTIRLESLLPRTVAGTQFEAGSNYEPKSMAKVPASKRACVPSRLASFLPSALPRLAETSLLAISTGANGLSGNFT